MTLQEIKPETHQIRSRITTISFEENSNTSNFFYILNE